METEHTPEEVLEMEKSEGNPWLKQIGLMLISGLLSTGISVTVVAFGWKSTIDTVNAVNQVKILEIEEKMQKFDKDSVKAGDLVYRDQLLDAKLSAINMQMIELKEQISNLHGGRSDRQ